MVCYQRSFLHPQSLFSSFRLKVNHTSYLTIQPQRLNVPISHPLFWKKPHLNRNKPITAQGIPAISSHSQTLSAEHSDNSNNQWMVSRLGTSQNSPPWTQGKLVACFGQCCKKLPYMRPVGTEKPENVQTRWGQLSLFVEVLMYCLKYHPKIMAGMNWRNRDRWQDKTRRGHANDSTCMRRLDCCELKV